MHQYMTAAKILLILSISNLVVAAPFVREIYESHNDVVAPVVVRNVVAMPKERRQPGSVSSDGSTPLESSEPPPSGSATWHPLLPVQDESPSPPGGPAALAISSPPVRTGSLPIVPASDQPAATVPSTSTPPYTAVTHDMLATSSHSADEEDPQMKTFMTRTKWITIGTIFYAIIAGGLLWHNRHLLRSIDPDCSTAKGSQNPCLDY